MVNISFTDGLHVNNFFMENLYYLVDEQGLYRNFVIFCREECELAPTLRKDQSIIYTFSQMDVAKRYFRKKGVTITPQIKTNESSTSSSSDKRRLRKGSIKGPLVHIGGEKNDGD